MKKYRGKFNMKVLIMFISIFQVSILTAYSSEIFFVTQSGAGLHNGLSAENAFSASDLNNSGNWGIGAGKISGGDTVNLNGAITSSLTMQGSGSSGSVIIIDGTSATLSGIFNASGRSYFTLQNLTFASGLTTTGIINCQLSTNAELNNIIIPNYNTSKVINLNGASYITVDGLILNNLKYTGIGLSYYGTTQAHHITFSNLNIVTTNDYMPDTQRDIITGCAHDITIEKSYFYKRWSSQAGTSAHNDIWQFWGSLSNPSCVNPYNMTLRHSLLVTDVGYDGNYQFLMWEEGSGAHNIYGNVFIKKGTASGGSHISIKEFFNNSTVNIYNNTFVQKDNGAYYLLNMLGVLSGEAPTVNFKNNIVYNNQNANGVIAKNAIVTFNHQYNTYYGGKNDGYSTTSCSVYASTGEMCDSDPLFTDYENNEFSLQINSDAKGSGINLGAEYQQQIKPGSTWPSPTLVTPTTINIGAYGNDILSTKQPMSPTLLSIN